MRIVHVVAGLWKDTGGPAEVIPNLCRAQAEAGAEVILCSIDGENALQVDALRDSTVDVHLFPASDNIIRYSAGMRDFLRRHGDFDIVHNHGHWLWPNWAAAAAARRNSAGLVTTPHGTLVPGMLSRARVKKLAAWTLFDRRIVARADVIHALSEAELKGMACKLHGAARKAVVIPNGVNLPEVSGQNTAKSGGTLLFLSRVASIKGAIQLLTAWSVLAPDFPDWRLKIVGPIDRELRAEIDRIMGRVERVELTGPVYHDDRWAHYQNAAAFVLPTLGEGLPTVLLEAAAYRLPVITTPEANFSELSQAGGSVLCAPNPAAIEATLREFFAMSPEQRQSIGENGANLIRARYDWQSIAKNWLSAYESIVRKPVGAASLKNRKVSKQ